MNVSRLVDQERRYRLQVHKATFRFKEMSVYKNVMKLTRRLRDRKEGTLTGKW